VVGIAMHLRVIRDFNSRPLRLASRNLEGRSYVSIHGSNSVVSLLYNIEGLVRDSLSALNHT
jgi:hypothetical protein